jgi:hypothetical protein
VLLGYIFACIKCFSDKKRKESQAISPLISYYTSAENSAPSFLGYYAISVTSSLQLK